MRRVIISGGGTGGHIYPAITIARAIADIEPTEFLYVGSKIGLENTLIPKEGLPFVTLDVRGLERKISVRNLVTLGKTAGSLIKAEGIIRKFKPDVVIGTGGFVCGPVLFGSQSERCAYTDSGTERHPWRHQYDFEPLRQSRSPGL